MPAFSRPLADCPDAALAAVAGVLTDIDDTLTHEGGIEPEALEALARLRKAGLPVIAITGRPMGWSEPFARVLFLHTGGLPSLHAYEAEVLGLTDLPA